MAFTLPRKGRLWFGVIVAIFALLLLVGSFGAWYESHDAMQNWHSVSGRIIRSGIKDRRLRGPADYATIDICYVYAVAERTFQQTTVSFRGGDQPIREATETVARYRAGDTVTIHYNPENPEEAVIEAEKSEALEMLVAGLAFSLLPILVFARDVKQIAGAKKLG